jgi:hypothetical protein
MDTKVTSEIDIVTSYPDFKAQIDRPEMLISEGGFAKIYRTKIIYQYEVAQ